jgi:hypothetical protein
VPDPPTGQQSESAIDETGCPISARGPMNGREEILQMVMSSTYGYGLFVKSTFVLICD